MPVPELADHTAVKLREREIRSASKVSDLGIPIPKFGTGRSVSLPLMWVATVGGIQGTRTRLR